jgi:hypothetical protein
VENPRDDTRGFKPSVMEDVEFGFMIRIRRCEGEESPMVILLYIRYTDNSLVKSNSRGQ